MENSILISVKRTLGIDAADESFDPDILMHINSAFAVLNQLGVGPEFGFQIEDDTALWAAFYGTDKRYNLIQTYVYLKVRVLFDPPNTGYLVEAMKEQLIEHETRISYYRESYAWTPPDDSDAELDMVLDGGTP
jgi:hypothetical protein